MPDLNVLVIGAGLGGLTLAQALRRHGIGVAVFERDASPWERPQGYRLHLDADAIDAAREVLPADPRAGFDVAAVRTEPFTTVLATDLSVVKRLPEHGEHANVDRAALRRILLSGLANAVHFGRKLTHYESTARGVAAFFADGTTASGDVLVGADGIGSAVRRQRAPHCRTADAGITALYGRLPMAVAEPFVPAETLTDIFTIASDDRKVLLGLGSVRYPEDYVVCVVGGRHEYFPEPGDGRELRAVAAKALRDWPGRAAELVRHADPESFFPVAMRTSVPATLDEPTNVTLLGDAIHAMTPTLGRGARGQGVRQDRRAAHGAEPPALTLSRARRRPPRRGTGCRGTRAAAAGTGTARPGAARRPRPPATPSSGGRRCSW
ncbi:NAD(P)/FAD-dependent oxidoreductase [Lentzea sp.]|uniref:FAD-dependent oxidoreductase n=1 Tax=Lentzea sp. TaxID=56099 RepID=UPI002BD25331|nr:NAD(P)/FAD-dependent oxidoreductase [Lentzea sp.]HUQ58206.1 NAD(P)/FAD-dependent oxidoreductase [Lentzea sp.]